MGLVLLGIGAMVAPFGSAQLPRTDAWAPITDTFIFLADLITWFLVISQFHIVRSRALLVLASGYLFAAVMNVPHLLTFPGALTRGGLLGAGLQTSVWLALSWMSGYVLAVIFYALMSKEPGTIVPSSSTRTTVAVGSAVGIRAEKMLPARLRRPDHDNLPATDQTIRPIAGWNRIPYP